MEICFKIKCDYEEQYICTEEWMEKNKKNAISGARYEVLRKGFIGSIEEMINHCLTYYIDIDVPKEYKVTKIYNIILSTGNFEPDDRTYSTVTSSIIFSTSNEKLAKRRFKLFCKQRKNLNVTQQGKNHFCWYGEDFAHNQIVFSYDLRSSYLIKKEDDV